MHTQLAVLGGGPGGYAAAFLAADEGLEVTLIEAEPRLGGTCLLRGCIPSKALLHVAKVIDEVEELTAGWGVEYSAPTIDIDKVRARKEKVISTLSGGLQQLAKRRKVNIIHARASFENSTTLRLEGDHASIPEGGTLTFDNLILASGSTPAMPPAFDIGSPRVMDSTGALELADIPKSLLVIGGGYIGLEMGTVYAHLGTKVSVVELTGNLLPGADRDLVKPLQKRLQKLFEDRIFLETKVGSVADCGDAIEVTFEGPAKYGVERYSRVLVSVGRRPNSRDIGLEKTNVVVTKSGFVECDKQQRTAEPNIFAIGDVAGEPMLAHKATHEGKLAAEVAAGEKKEWVARVIPSVAYTDPEIAWVGVTENEAKEKGLKVGVGKFPWAASGRAIGLGRTEGFTKLIFDEATHRLVGAGIVGPHAGDLITEAALAIEMGCEAADIGHTIHPHPTLSETVMESAEGVHGQSTHIYKRK